MQEQVNEKVIAFSVRGGKLTAELLQKALRKFLSGVKKGL